MKSKLLEEYADIVLPFEAPYLWFSWVVPEVVEIPYVSIEVLVSKNPSS
jgi:hypothetical protein